MKYNISDMSFSIKIVILLIVLLVYTFYFIDEELLVSLVTTLVLVGVYNMLSKSLNELFMSNINDAFKKLSLYLVMNLTVLQRLSVQFNDISILSNYRVVYLFLIERTISKMDMYKSFFVNMVNFMYYNLMLYILSFNLQIKYFSNFRLYSFDDYFQSKSFNRLFNGNFNLKLKFLVNVSKVLFKI